MTTTSKFISILILLIIIVAALLIFDNNRVSSIKLAVLLPLSGSGADQGEWVKQGFEVALEGINKNAKYPLELVYQDTQGAPKNTIAAYNQLKSTIDIPVVFTWGSGAGIALTPLVNRDHVVQIGVATAADGYSTPDDFTFRNFPSASQEAQFSADAALNTLDKRTVSILKMNNDYGLSSAKAFGSVYQEKGGQIVSEDVFEPGTTDFRTLLTKIRRFSPQLIYLATYPTEGAILLKQARELGMTTQFMASVAILGGKDFFDIAGNSSNGLIVVSSVPPLNKKSTGELGLFISSYERLYKMPINSQQIYAARSFDALRITSSAIDKCERDTACIKSYLFNLHDYPGASGTFSFDQNGDISSSFFLQKVENGAFVAF